MCLTMLKCFLIRAVYLLFHHKSAMRFGNGLKVHTSDAQRHNLHPRHHISHQPLTAITVCLLVLNGSWCHFIVAMGRDYVCVTRPLWALFKFPHDSDEHGKSMGWY